MQRLRAFLLLFAGSTLVGLYFASQSMSNPTMAGLIEWSWAVRVNLIYYWAWGFAVPVVIAIAKRVPLEQGRLRRSLLLHAFASFVLTLTLIVISELALMPFRKSSFVEVLPFSLTVNFHSSLPTYWLILAGYTAFDYWQKYRERETAAARLAARLSAARLDALRMQLNPHFLFNTLNSVSSLMYQDVEKADAMITRLGDFLRLTINEDMAPVTSVAREIEFARTYLEIEKIRFEERLTVVWEIDPETLTLKIPSFLLQPLIENAVHHGISTCEEGGTMRIRSSRENDQLTLLLENDGRVLPREQRREGIGLRNTRERIAEIYGQTGSMTLVLDSGRARVEIRLPAEELSDAE